METIKAVLARQYLLLPLWITKNRLLEKFTNKLLHKYSTMGVEQGAKLLKEEAGIQLYFFGDLAPQTQLACYRKIAVAHMQGQIPKDALVSIYGTDERFQIVIINGSVVEFAKRTKLALAEALEDPRECEEIQPFIIAIGIGQNGSL